MATLVLTTIGTAVGGPIGGAIGAVIGSQVDQRLLAPRRQGARLGALTVQTSAYGQPLPKLFGTLRVAGTVIWATDLREEQTSAGGGKGKSKTATYSYSASFAVALSARPIRAVHRIWSDGKLLRGLAGDWKSETGFRLYLGDEAQPVDPLLAAAEGANGTPAYRGTAYAVFEDMQLADFGNRIPSLTFEVEADAAPISLGMIATEISDGAVSGETGAMLGGYAAGGDSVRGAIETLSRAIPLRLRDDGVRIVLTDAYSGSTVGVPAVALGARAENERADRHAIDRRAAGTLPDEVTVAYYEPERDYQAGLQRARKGGAARRTETIELAAAMSAGGAKAVAEHRLADAWAARSTGAATLPWRWLDLRPGDTIMLDGGTRWCIAGWTIEKMVVVLKLRGIADAQAMPATAQPGRATTAMDALHGATTIVLLDLPPLDDAATTPRMWLAAAGASPGWRRAAVIVSSDGGASWASAGSTAAPAVLGTVRNVLVPADANLFDEVGSIEVELLNDAMVLIGRTADALVDGANLAMLGDELIQFGTAVSLGQRRWRLSRLLRGRRGTEAAMAHHVEGERFVLVEPATLLPLELPLARIDGELRVIASGVADTIGVEASAVATACALRPPSPVHLRAERLRTALRFAWARRSRSGWSWADGEVPLVEESERYLVTITPASGVPRTIETIVPTFDYENLMMAADGASSAATFKLEVVQRGTFGASPVASARFTLDGDRL